MLYVYFEVDRIIASRIEQSSQTVQAGERHLRAGNCLSPVIDLSVISGYLIKLLYI